MDKVKNSLGDGIASTLPQSKRTKALHPADAAGMTRNKFFQTDLWIVGGKEYKVPKNTVPSVIVGAFLPSDPKKTVPITMAFDQNKFSIDRLTGLEEGREHLAWVHSNLIGKGLVEVTLRDNTFVIALFEKAHNQQFPFTKEEFLSAVLAGKVDVELDQLESDSDSNSEVETDQPTPASPRG